MNHRYISDTEIHQHQRDIRLNAYRARHSFTISGIRSLFGNTFIALGLMIHGQCEKRADIRTTSPAVASAHSV